MRTKWMFLALAPLFSFAAVQEEWLSESTFPEELQENELRNEEISAREDTRHTFRSDRRREHRRAPRKAEVVEENQGTRWKAFLERLTLKKEQGSLNIVTNRKSRDVESDAIAEEARPQGESRTEKRVLKRKNELLKKNNRRIPRDEN
jgi:hypothetical protein